MGFGEDSRPRGKRELTLRVNDLLAQTHDTQDKLQEGQASGQYYKTVCTKVTHRNGPGG